MRMKNPDMLKPMVELYATRVPGENGRRNQHK